MKVAISLLFEIIGFILLWILTILTNGGSIFVTTLVEGVKKNSKEVSF